MSTTTKNKIKEKKRKKNKKKTIATKKKNTKIILHLLTNCLMFVINSEFGIYIFTNFFSK
jgi:ATP-dependent Clp protease adapter protein ClpS